MQMARQLHKLKVQAKVMQQKQKQVLRERPQTQMAPTSGEGTIQQISNKLRVQTDSLSLFINQQTGTNELVKERLYPAK